MATIMTNRHSVLSAARRLRLLVSIIALGGSVVAIEAVMRLPGIPVPPVWRLLLAAVVAGVGNLALVHLRFGHNQYSFTWSEVALVVGLVLLPAPWLVLIGGMAVAVAHLATRRAPAKVVFNACAFVVGVALANLVGHRLGMSFGDTSHLGRPATWAAIAAVSLVHFTWNAITVACAVAFSQDVAVRSVVAKGVGVNLLVWCGNTATAIVLVAVGSAQPAVLGMFPFVYALTFFIYRSYIGALQQRDVSQVLEAASRELQQTREEEVAEVVLSRLPALMGAEFAEVLVVGADSANASLYRWPSPAEPQLGDASVLASAFWPRLVCEAEPFEVVANRAPVRQADELRTLGLAMAVVVPMHAHDRCIGSVRIGFRGRVRLRRGERQVLVTFANHAATALQHAQVFERIGAERRQLNRILDCSNDGIVWLDEQGLVRRWNPAMERMTGVRSDQAIGRSLFDGLAVVAENGLPLSTAWLGEQLARSGQLRTSVRIDSVGSGRRWLHLSAARTNGADGDAVIVVHDATERKQFEAQLTHQALHDPLTGLGNRTLLLDRLTAAGDRVPASRHRVAVLFLDLDRFKVINDSLGHDAGDQLLVTVSERITACLRPGDTAARLGGDEFVVLCEHVSGEWDALAIAERVNQAVCGAYHLAGDEAFVTVSIGVAVSHASVDPSALLRDADAAMYLAKERGRNRCELFTSDMRDRAVARLEVENDLRHGIERGDLRLFCQPYLRVADPRVVVGAEALVRWEHPTRGLVEPCDFIELAEESGLVQPLGRWVLNEACRWLSRIDVTHPDRALDYLSVNVSAHQLTNENFVDSVALALQAWDVNPGRLCLEITESALIKDIDGTLSVFRELKSLGVRLALDDFGTGFSALNYLRILPVDAIKIDRTFVARITQNRRDRAIVGAMIDLAHALDLVVVAEGVEHRAQAKVLRALGCDLVQGFLYARPRPLPVDGITLPDTDLAAPYALGTGGAVIGEVIDIPSYARG